MRPGGSKPGGSEGVGGRGAGTETGAGADRAGEAEEPTGTTPQYASCLWRCIVKLLPLPIFGDQAGCKIRVSTGVNAIKFPRSILLSSYFHQSFPTPQAFLDV